jgi:hypothetical protein|tara:strand:+ start:5590 stop:6090 length:501 start_codon:yes stop_codon:yes gene_type:complete
MNEDNIKNYREILRLVGETAADITYRINNYEERLKETLDAKQHPPTFICPYCSMNVENIEVGISNHLTFEEFQDIIGERPLSDLPETTRKKILDIIHTLKPAHIPMNEQNLSDFKSLLFFAKTVKSELIKLNNVKDNITDTEQLSQTLLNVIINIEQASKTHLSTP